VQSDKTIVDLSADINMALLLKKGSLLSKINVFTTNLMQKPTMNHNVWKHN
jgi:hypothetical protein